MKKKILIIYATYGSGHKAVAEYIQKYLLEQNNELEVLMVDLLKYSASPISNISDKISDFFLLKFPKGWSFVYNITNNKFCSEISSYMSRSVFKNKNIKKIITNFNPDLVISTHSFGGSLFDYYSKKSLLNCELITVITDYHVHKLWLKGYKNSQSFVIANKNDVKTLIKAGVKRSKIHPIGLPIYPVVSNNFDKKTILKEFGLTGKRPICLFFGGGGNGGTLSLPYIKSMIKSNIKIDIIYIAGRNKKSKDKVDKWISKYNADNVKTVGYVNNVPELLNVCDFVISKPGGIQATESLYFNKPLIMINSSGGQENANLKYFEQKRYGKFFNRTSSFISFINKISDDERIIKKYALNMKKDKNKGAIKEIYKIINEKLNNK